MSARVLLFLFLGVATALAADPTAPADFTIDRTVVAPQPDRYGTNLAINGFADFNNWTYDPGFEPFVLRKTGTATAGGADFLVNAGGPTTTVYDVLGDGFFDGAAIRTYRIVGGQVTLLRTDVIDRYVGGFNRIVSARLTSPSFTDGRLNANQTYHYTVRAYDTSGNQSPNSNIVAATALASGGVAQTVSGNVTTTPTDTVAPAAPTGLTAVANADGTVSLTWTANTEPDLAGYWVFRAESPPADHNRIRLQQSGPPVLPGDIYFIDFNPVNVPMDRLSPRVQSYFGESDTWRERGGAVWPWNLPVSKTRVTSDPCPVNPGKCHLRLTAPGAHEVSIRQARWGTPTSFYGSLVPGTVYRAEVWLRQQGVADRSVTFRLTGGYADVSHTWTDVTAGWQKFSYEFEAPPYPEPADGVGETILSFNGPGDVWIDNFTLHDPSRPVFAHREEARQQLIDFMPGWIRSHTGHTNGRWGSTLEDWTNDDSLAQNQFTTAGGRGRPEQPYHLPYALQLAKDAGANPWIVVGSYMDEAEWLALAEYLAGPAGTPHGDKRIAQRGVSTPWSDEFSRIRIEFGNEMWNPVFEWTLSGTAHGQFAEYFFNIFRQSPHFGAFAGKVDFVVNGQLVSAGTNGYGASALGALPAAGASTRAATYGDVALYLGGWDANIEIGHGEFNAEGLSDYLLYPGTYGKHWFDAHVQTRETLAAQGRQYRLGNYECGPGYDLPSGNDPFDPVSEAYGKSLAAGVATLDTFLYGTYAGIDPQCYFTFQTGTNWASHSYLSNGNHPYPSWLALRMRNRHVTGDMLATGIRSVPTIDQPAWINTTTGGIAAPAAPGTPLVVCRAFRDGAKYGVFVISRKVAGETPVTLRLPFAAASSVTLYRIEGDPAARNDQGTLSVTEESTTGLPFANPFQLTLPPSSARLYVFDGAVTDSEPHPSCTITQALSQADPTSRATVTFAVHFSQPVTGFSASDVIVSGSAGPATVTVTEPVPRLGVDFLVEVGGLTSAGDVQIDIPAGAAQNAGGQGNLAAERLDATVTFLPAPLEAYDDFDVAPSQMPFPPFLQSVGSGAGFAGPWQLTGWAPATYTDGYKLASSQPLVFANLRRKGSYCVGGRDFGVAGRTLDVAGTFSFYSLPASSPPVIGRDGTVLWMSALFRKETADNNRLLLFTVPTTTNLSIGGSNLGIGFAGENTPAVAGGTRYWSLQVRNAANNGFDVVRSAVPVVTGQTALLVLKCSFGATDRFDLWVNPPTLGGAAPAVADATWTTSGVTNIGLLQLGFSGGTTGVNQSSIDEIRFGESYAEVTPTFAPIELWRLQHFATSDGAGSAADGADADGDGVPNLVEYALGTDPTNPHSVAVPSASIAEIAGGSHLVIEAPWNPAATDVSGIVEVSSDLQTWQSGEAVTETLSTGPVLRVRDRAALAASARRFIRLHVSH